MKFLKFLPFAALACLAGTPIEAYAEAAGGFVTAASKSCTSSPCTLSVTVPDATFFLLEGVYCQVTQTVGLTTLSLPVPANEGGTGSPVIAIPLVPGLGTLIGNITLPAVVEFTDFAPIAVIAAGTFSPRTPGSLSCTIVGSAPLT